MKLLLDTHIFLWLVEGSPSLSSPAQAALTDPAHDLVLSAASIWELAIKVGNGKLILNESVDGFVSKWVAVYQVNLLPVRSTHAAAVSTLPDLHRDPFDRMLVVQSLLDGMTLVTADPKLSAYQVPVIW